jgi:hypothetical protein
MCVSGSIDSSPVIIFIPHASATREGMIGTSFGPGGNRMAQKKGKCSEEEFFP